MKTRIPSQKTLFIIIYTENSKVRYPLAQHAQTIVRMLKNLFEWARTDQFGGGWTLWRWPMRRTARWFLRALIVSGVGVAPNYRRLRRDRVIPRIGHRWQDGRHGQPLLRPCKAGHPRRGTLKTFFFDRIATHNIHYWWCWRAKKSLDILNLTLSLPKYHFI